MLKKLIGKVFGFEGEIRELRRQVKELSWDSSFGMWTRGAFLQFCHVMPRDISFIDLNKVHELNEKYSGTTALNGAHSLFLRVGKRA